ncbi:MULTISPECIES: hypothetical protein [Halorussus]|uniref:hypothetical protein n=1 Tax=Halorussus TaxID=1070314 RepID=UPI000E21036F|nr:MULTISPECIES: hypothetical protein [Halorussus]NHN57795.1 hypothetical protein [Halorussus sp. JP-T4]
MVLEDRIRRGEELDPVSPEQVMRYWLGEEVDAAGGDLDPDALGTEPALRQELLDRNDIAERIFGSEVADWYRVDLSAAELRNLRVVVGPHDEDWRALTDDNRIESVARRVHEADDLERLDEEAPKDLLEVVEFADDLAEGGDVGRLVVVEEGEDPAYVADGNHRAVAHVLHLLRGGEFEGQEAYLGVRE